MSETTAPEPIRRIFDRWKQQRERGWSEVAIPTREPRSMRRLLAGAGAPLDAIEALRAPKQTRAMAAAKQYLEDDSHDLRALALLGQRGVGKTVAACWVLGRLLQECDLADRPSGDEVRQTGFGYFLHATTLSRYLGDKASSEWMDRLGRCSALLLDDLGKEPLSGYRADEFRAALFELVNTRHGNRRATLLTSNLNATDVERRYGKALMDRLRDRGLVSELAGESLRGRQAAK